MKNERKETEGRTFVSFTVAVNRGYRKSEGSQNVDFIPVVAYEKLGEICSDYLEKGKRVLVDGRIQVKNYIKDDEQKWTTEIVADEVTILSAPRQH